MTTGSFDMSSHAIEYSVSKLERTTPLKSAGGYAGTLVNMFIGPLPNSLARFDICERLSGNVHRQERIEINIGVHRNRVRLRLGDRRLCALSHRPLRECWA